MAETVELQNDWDAGRAWVTTRSCFIRWALTGRGRRRAIDAPQIKLGFYRMYKTVLPVLKEAIDSNPQTKRTP